MAPAPAPGSECRSRFGPNLARGDLAARLGEGDKALLLLVPELERHRANPVPQRERGHVVEDRVLVVRALQVVVRYARAQVVNVVVADVAAEELQHARQL